MPGSDRPLANYGRITLYITVLYARLKLSTNLLRDLVLDVGVLRLRHLCPGISLRLLLVFQVLR